MKLLIGSLKYGSFCTEFNEFTKQKYELWFRVTIWRSKISQVHSIKRTILLKWHFWTLNQTNSEKKEKVRNVTSFVGRNGLPELLD